MPNNTPPRPEKRPLPHQIKHVLNTRASFGSLLLTIFVLGYAYSALTPTSLPLRLLTIADNIIAALAFATLLFLFGDPIRSWLQRRPRTIQVEYLKEPPDIFQRLATAIQPYDGKSAEDAHLTIITPVLFTTAYIDHLLAHTEDLDRITNCRKYYNIFQRIYEHIVVKGGNGAYDITLIGRTDNPVLDTATLNLLRTSHQFHKPNPPGTCELGYHQNLNEYALILIGTNDRHNGHQNRVKQYEFMMRIDFGSRFRSLVAQVITNHQAIEDHAQLTEPKFADAKTRTQGRYIINNHLATCDTEDWQVFTNELTTFLQPPNPNGSKDTQRTA